jgi:hypothetical protein
MMSEERRSALASKIVLLTQSYDQLQQLTENLSEEDKAKVNQLNNQYFELLGRLIPTSGFEGPKL